MVASFHLCRPDLAERPPAQKAVQNPSRVADAGRLAATADRLEVLQQQFQQSLGTQVDRSRAAGLREQLRAAGEIQEQVVQQFPVLTRKRPPVTALGLSNHAVDLPRRHAGKCRHQLLELPRWRLRRPSQQPDT